MTRRSLAGRSGTAAIVLLLLFLTQDHCRAEMAGAFPNLEPWPVSLALAGIPAALGEGVEAVLENPTGMLRGPGRAVAFSHASLFAGGLVRHQAAALVWTRREPRNHWQDGTVVSEPGEIRSAFGIGVTNLSGELPASESYGELEVSLAYTQRVPLGLKSGIRVRFVQASSTVDGSGGGGIALDLGFEGRIRRWRAGGVVRNFSSQVAWDRSQDGPLPRAYFLGIERGFPRGFDLLAGATLLSSGKPRRLGAAAQWHIPSTPLLLRSGPAWRDAGGEGAIELSNGIGIEVRAFTADYAMRTGPPGLGEIHRFSLRATLP